MGFFRVLFKIDSSIVMDRYTLPDIFQNERLYGIPCACCDCRKCTSSSVHDKQSRRIVDLCPHCQAFICDTCAKQSLKNQCRWCGSAMYPRTPLLLSFHQQFNDPSFLCYSAANENVNEMRDWVEAMSMSHQSKFHFSKLFWINMIENMGWRFFLKSGFLLKQQHPIQCRLLVSIMKWSSNRMLPHRRQTFPSEMISSILAENQFIYPKAQTIVTMHHLSMIAMRRLIRPDSFELTMKYLLSNFGERLFLGLGICSDLPVCEDNDDEYNIDDPDR